jgi:hypothetical protein
MTNQQRAIHIFLNKLFDSTKKISRADLKFIFENEDVKCSDSTITRMLLSINADYGVSIVNVGGFYKIDVDDSDPNYLEKYANIKGLLFRQIIQKKISEPNEVSDHIEFTNPNINKGVEWIDDVLEAILWKRNLTIEYQTFENEVSKTHIVSPLFIKEYLNRWYLICKIENSRSEYYNLAFDRMKEVTMIKSKFKAEKIPKEIFKNTIGINYSGEPKEVRFWCTPIQAKYLKTLPLHPSQTIISETKEGMEFSIFVNINHELQKIIMSLGSEIKVLSPKSFRNDILDEIEKMKELYK